MTDQRPVFQHNAPRILLGIYLAELHQGKEAELLDRVLKDVMTSLPDIQITEIGCDEEKQPLRTWKFSEKSWGRVLKISAAKKLGACQVYGHAISDTRIVWPKPFDFKSSGYKGYDAYRRASCMWTGRWLHVAIRMNWEPWMIPDVIAESMLPSVLFAAQHLKLFQANIALAGVPAWESTFLRRTDVDDGFIAFAQSMDRVVRPSWLTVIHNSILNRYANFKWIEERFHVELLGKPGKEEHILIRLKPKISDVTQADLEDFVRLVM